MILLFYNNLMDLIIKKKFVNNSKMRVSLALALFEFTADCRGWDTKIAFDSRAVSRRNDVRMSHDPVHPHTVVRTNEIAAL